MTADAARLEVLEATVAEHSELLTKIVRYLEAGLHTAHLEGRRLDANTSAIAELERRIARLS